MARTRLSKPPSPYPRIPFHCIRLTQLLSSIIVTSIISYFIHHLSIALYAIPWTFILLITVSLLTIASYIITTIFYHQRTLRPKISSLINGAFVVLWVLAFSLMVWNLSGTLGHKCDIANWSHETGIMICRMYKALAAFTITGLLSTVCSFLLDLRLNRQSASRGTYNPMGDIKVAHDTSDPHPHGPYEEPALEVPEYSYGVKRPYVVQRPIEAQEFGYSAPSEQTAYDGSGGTQLHGGYGNGHGI